MILVEDLFGAYKMTAKNNDGHSNDGHKPQKNDGHRP